MMACQATTRTGRPVLHRLVFLLIAFAPPMITAAENESPSELVGKVVGVHDGDTLTLLVDRRQYKVRLEGIDAPEIGQDFGARAKQALSKQCFGKSARVKTYGRDRYGRTLGEVFVDGQSATRKQVILSVLDFLGAKIDRLIRLQDESPKKRTSRTRAKSG